MNEEGFSYQSHPDCSLCRQLEVDVLTVTMNWTVCGEENGEHDGSTDELFDVMTEAIYALRQHHDGARE